MNNIIIGLTGPTGAGKSFASSAAAELGFKVIDCDRLARVAVEKGSAGLSAVCNVFGNDILNSDGTLNRKALAGKAFSSKENTELLNKTLLPFISELVKEQAVGERVLLDAPTLFESGTDSICDATIAVLADSEIRLGRIMSRDNLTKEEAKLRMSAGKSDDFYKKHADYIIYSNRGEKLFINSFKEILLKLADNNN